MVATLEPVAAVTPPRRRRRSMWWGLAATVLAAVLVGGGISWWYYAAHYNPLTTGFTAGPYGANGANLGEFDTDLGTVYYVRGPATATADWFELIGNDGDHDVRLEHMDYISQAGVRWSPYEVVPGGWAFGRKLPFRALPATIPAHGYIRMVLSFRRGYSCKGGSVSTSTAQVTWSALGVHHTTPFPLIGLSSGDAYVDCPQFVPKDAGN